MNRTVIRWEAVDRGTIFMLPSRWDGGITRDLTSLIPLDPPRTDPLRRNVSQPTILRILQTRLWL